MRGNNWAVPVFLLAMATLVALPACSVNVKQGADGEDKQVDIKALGGGIHVSNDADAGEVGIAVYPGARAKPRESDGANKNANVNISGFGYGIEVVALEYESGDAPAKVISFYKDQLKKYGSILECHSTGDVVVNRSFGSHDSKELTCDGDTGRNTELKVGHKDDQHIVAVKPEGNGSSFSLVYVRTHDKGTDI